MQHTSGGEPCSVQEADGTPCQYDAHPGVDMRICWRHASRVLRQALVFSDPDGQPEPSADHLRPAPNEGIVYYVRVGDQLKIGTTTTGVNKRFAGTLPPDAQLLATEPGGRDLERARHAEFADERIAANREWFTGSARLWQHVTDVRERHGEPRWEGLTNR